jgi:hypothetical protein
LSFDERRSDRLRKKKLPSIKRLATRRAATFVLRKGESMGKRDRGATPKIRQPGPARDKRGIIKLVPKLRKIKPLRSSTRQRP